MSSQRSFYRRKHKLVKSLLETSAKSKVCNLDSFVKNDTLLEEKEESDNLSSSETCSTDHCSDNNR